MVKLDHQLVQKKRKELSTWSREQIVANFHAKYIGPDSLDETLEASHILLGKEYELYLSDEQYAELAERSPAQRTCGENRAIKSLEILQKVQEVGADEYFSLAHRLGVFLRYSAIAIVVSWLGLTIMGSIFLTVITQSFHAVIFPFHLIGARGTPEGLALAWIIITVVPMTYAYSLMPNKKAIMNSCERNKDRLMRKSRVS